MTRKKFFGYFFMISAFFLITGISPALAQEGKKFKVLVVFSYEEMNQNTIRNKAGIEPVLGRLCEIKYFYLNTKMDFNGGPGKAKEAFALYREYQPDGVIATEDDAQSMFVLPYLKDKVKTPVMFCGVNAGPEKYGYPASNVSGILERLHLRDTIAMAQQLIPSVKTVGFMMKHSPVAELISSQINKEAGTYSAISAGIKYPKTLKEAVAMAGEMKKECDILYISGMPGLAGEDGQPLQEKDANKAIINAFGKPVIGDAEHHVKMGALCSVVHRMEEQGEVAAQMLMKAMLGTPVDQIPITRNQHGKRVLNVTVLRELGIKPQAEMLIKTEFVKTEN